MPDYRTGARGLAARAWAGGPVALAGTAILQARFVSDLRSLHV